MIKRYDLYSNCDCTCNDFGLEEVSEGDFVQYEDHEREVKELERRVRWLEHVILQAICAKQLHLEFDIEEFHYLRPVPSQFADTSKLLSDSYDVTNMYGGVMTVVPTPEDFK